MIVLQKGSAHAKNRNKIRINFFVPSPQIFPTSGAPISGLGADIRMPSPPSARGSCVLKIRSDARFLYGHSKTVSGNGEVVARFSKKWRSYLGACCPAPSAHSVQRGGALQIDVISLHNKSVNQVWRGLHFFGENVSNI